MRQHATAALVLALSFSCGDDATRGSGDAIARGGAAGIAAAGAAGGGSSGAAAGGAGVGSGAGVASGGEGTPANLGRSGASSMEASDGVSSGVAADAGASGGDAGAGRGALFFDPPEGVYSVSLSVNTAGVSRPIALRNETPSPVAITALEITPLGSGFVLDAAPATPLSIAPAGELRLDVRFIPDADATATTLYSAVLSAVSEGGALSVEAALFGLAMNAGNDEASLDQVVQALGHAVDVGGTTTTLGTGSMAIGDEVFAARFVKAAEGPVGLQPVARYSPFEAAPYGYYTGDAPGVTLQPLGTMSEGAADNIANRTLFPPLDAGSLTTFDPGAETFGIYAESAANVASLGPDGRFFQEDGLNADQSGVLPIHRVRVYPLKGRAGQTISNSFLLACEEASNSDYQDYVFVLSNVAIAN